MHCCSLLAIDRYRLCMYWVPEVTLPHPDKDFLEAFQVMPLPEMVEMILNSAQNIRKKLK